MTARITQQQPESYLWGAATLLRGTIDAGDYKQFIFPLLFYKRLCDVFDEETQTALAESGGDQQFSLFPENHRFQIPLEAHWRRVRQAATDVGRALQNALRAIETANPDKFYGIFGDAQWTNKDRLSDAMLRDLVEHFSALELTVANLLEDELGQGYEYLIKKFADDSGHTAAEFYTNRTVVNLMTAILQPQPGESIYDPTCGSGGMLRSAIAHLRLYGQERNLMTSSIARMNCFLHGIEDFRIERGDTLAEPKLVQGDCLMRFDVVLANPPYSIKQWDRDAFASDRWGRNLVDEAQDFPPSFLRLCYELLKPVKRLVYAYDELQNLNAQPLPAPEDIFGKNVDGTPRVHFTAAAPGKPEQDIILEKCYRNSRPILVTAHALGFGIYRQPDQRFARLSGRQDIGLIQMFDQKNLWLDVGYAVAEGHLEDGQWVTLERTASSSPEFLENHSPVNDLIQFLSFDSTEAQSQWVAEAIMRNLQEEELRHDDIVVINPDSLTTRTAVGPLRKILFEKGVNFHLAGVDTSPDVFFRSAGDSVTFTGIYRAKGNEAAMVYIINAQDCFSAFGNLTGVRNRLFTAMTRSKAWGRVVGVGPQMQRLTLGFEEVKKNNFRLVFRYPTAEERRYLNIVNRDMTAEEKQRVTKGQSDLAALLEDLESGKVYLEDLGVDQVERLRVLLNRG